MRFVALPLLLVACHGWSGSDRRERKPGPQLYALELDPPPDGVTIERELSLEVP